MATFWYCKGGDRELGPFSLRQLQALAEAGKLFPDTQVREKGSQEWLAAAMLDDLFPSLAPEPVAAAAAPAALSKSGPMKAVLRAKPLAAEPAPAAGPPSPAPAARAVPRGQPAATPVPAPAVARAVSPVPPVAPAPVMREVKPLISVTPPGGAPVGAGVAPPSRGSSGTDDLLSIASVGLAIIGLATFAVPYAPIALGILAACVGAGCFFLAHKSERALGLSIGGAVLGLAAAGIGAFQMNANRTAPPEVAKPSEPVTPAAAPLDPAQEEAARNARILAEAKEKQEREKAQPAAAVTPVATEKPENKASAIDKKPAVATASGLSPDDPRRALIAKVKRWAKTPGGIKFGDKSVKVTAAWLSNDPAGGRPDGAGIAGPRRQPAVQRIAPDAPPKEGEGDESREAIDIPGLEKPPLVPKGEAINRPAELDKPIDGPPPAAEEPTALRGKYLCIEVQVLVTAEGKSLSLAGWSAAAKNAVLIDADGAPVPAVEGHSRGKGATVSPGGSHSQVLVFECPAAGPVDSLKLVLAGSIAGLTNPIGFEIKSNLLGGNAAAAPPIAAPARPTAPAPREPKEGDPAAAPKPADAPPAPADAPPPAGDPDDEERIVIPGLTEPGAKFPIRRAPMIK